MKTITLQDIFADHSEWPRDFDVRAECAEQQELVSQPVTGGTVKKPASSQRPGRASRWLH